MSISPFMLQADACGRIFEHTSLKMATARAGRLRLPVNTELMPLPPESELFLLPERRAVGYNERTGQFEQTENLAVAAFAAPGYTLSAHPAYIQEENAPLLPLFAYGAVGYARGRFWICAQKVDNDPRQQFGNIKPGRIERGCRDLLAVYPQNRLVGHIINNCVRRYDCPAARNFALGRYEAPLPTSRVCNAACIGCISQQKEDSPLKTTPQCRLGFIPTPQEIAEVMLIHEQREKRQPIYSFGQGCEGDPLMNADLLCESIAQFRSMQKKGWGHGTINCNTNASCPKAIAALAKAGLTSLRVSLNSARPEIYTAYYRPKDYSFADVCESIAIAKAAGVFISLNLLYFPGLTDTQAEIDALIALCKTGVNMIQLRNLNIDPQWYLQSLGVAKNTGETAIGLQEFMGKLKNKCEGLKFGYFNPYVGDKAYG